MCKVISVFQSNNTTGQAGGNAPALVNRTILDRYKALADSCDNEIPLGRLCKFLSGENARIMNRTKVDGSLDDTVMEECREFADFYIKKVSQELRRKVYNQLGGLPFFLREGVAALSVTTLPFPWNQPLELSTSQLAQVSSLMKFIAGIENDTAATFCVLNPDGDPPMVQSFVFLKDKCDRRCKASRHMRRI